MVESNRKSRCFAAFGVTHKPSVYPSQGTLGNGILLYQKPNKSCSSHWDNDFSHFSGSWTDVSRLVCLLDRKTWNAATDRVSRYGYVLLQVLEFELPLILSEYPSLRVFTVAPGLVATGNTAPAFTPYAFDHADLTGMLALYLSQPKADYLRGSFVSVNWDVTEMEAQKDEIVEKKFLKSSWLPVLPMFGGKGLTG